jgi:hypothetical protein
LLLASPVASEENDSFRSRKGVAAVEKETDKPPPCQQERNRLRLSGKATAFGLVVAFLITAILIPAVLKLPTWIDYEIVLVVWWGIWMVVLTTLLYHGKRVADDHQLPPPRSWLNWWTKQEPVGNEESKSQRKNTSSSGWDGWYWSGPGDAEGCLWVLGAIVAVIVLVFALWFLIEVAIPLMLFILYLVPRGMLSHVINDRHHCKGRLGRSFRWSLVWATLYTVPLAGVVWCVHFLLAREMQGPMVP